MAEVPHSLPQTWEWVRLNSLLQKIGAGSTPLGGKEVYVPHGVKFLRSQNVWNDGLRLDNVAFIKPETHAKMAGTAVLANDILFNITGASIGRCAVVPSDFDEGNVSQHVTIVRTLMPELNGFLHKVLISSHVQQAVMDVQVGVSREGLSIAKFGQFLIPLPPLAEQFRIVSRVDELMRICDALEAKGQVESAQHSQLVQTLLGALTASATPEELADNWQRVATHFDLLLDRPEAVDALEQTILQLAVRGRLVAQDPTDEPASTLLHRIRDNYLHAGFSVHRTHGDGREVAKNDQLFDVPSGWEWTRIDVVAEVLGGIQKTQLRRPIRQHYPYLRVANVQRDVLQLDEIERFELSTDELTRWRLQPGDLLIVEGNGSANEVGRCAVWDGSIDPCVFQNHLIRVRCRIPAQMAFMKMYLNSPSGAQEMRRLAITTSGLFNLSVGKIRSYAIPVPPLAEQIRIVARVESLRRRFADLRHRLATRQTTQAHIAEALIDEVA